MCGIIGVCNFESKPNLEEVIKCGEFLKNRGPDNFGHYSSERIAVFHTRLKILDLSENSNQPIIDKKTGNVLIFNGEIYNYLELKKDLISLAGFSDFNSTGDAEVLLKCLNFYKIEEILPKLEGMFAFAFWNNKLNQLILARDKFGEKPLYYSRLNHNEIIFSSSVQSLIQYEGLKKKINFDQESIDQYFCLNYLLFEKTFFKNIFSINPSSYLIFKKDNKVFLKNYEYYSLANVFNKKKLNISFNEAIENLELKLSKSVEKRLRCDVEKGCFFSGGIDSSLMFHFYNEYAKKLGEKKSNHFLDFDEKKFSELNYANQIANKSNIQLTIHKVPEAKEVAFDFDKIVLAIDQPISDTAIISNYYLSKFSKPFSKVVISGDGGDELFFGYETYTADIFKRYLNFFPNSINSIISNFFQNKNIDNSKIDLSYKISKFFENVNYKKLSHPLWRSVFSNNELKSLKRQNEKVNYKNIFKKIFHEYEKVKHCSILDQNAYVDFKTWFPNNILYKLDRTSMFHAQETRLPFLDTELVEYAISLPLKFKINIFNKKIILKKLLLRKGYEKKIVYRKKSGFNSPVGSWIKNNKTFRELAFDLLNTSCISSFCNVKFMQKLILNHINGKSNNEYKIFSIMVLSQWLLNNKLKI